LLEVRWLDVGVGGCGFGSGGCWGRLGEGVVLGCSVGGACVCLAGEKEKVPRNRVWVVSAPRLPQTRTDLPPIAVRTPPFLGSKYPRFCPRFLPFSPHPLPPQAFIPKSAPFPRRNLKHLCKFAPDSPGNHPATEFRLSPHRDRGKRGADTGGSRFKGEEKERFYKNVKGGKKWGGRTAIDVCPPRVSLLSASSFPQT